MVDLEHRSEDEDHAPPPPVTTPQGTQLHAVEHGHEERDVNFASLKVWLGVLAGLIIFSHIVSFGFYRVLLDTGKHPEPASRLLGQRPMPPEPRLLPNRADSVPGTGGASPIQQYQALQGPGDYGQAEVKKDQEALAALGFFNEVKEVPVVPDAIVQKVVTAGGSTGTPEQLTEERMPSDPTGGVGVENRLR